MDVLQQIEKAESSGKLKELCIDMSGEIELLKERVESLVRSKFESKAERQLRDLLERTQKSLFDDNSPSTALDSSENQQKPDHNKKKKPSGGRKPLPSDIERHEKHLDVDHHACTACGSENPLKPVSQKISEKVHITPAKVSVEVTIRPVYSCGSCENMAVAALPPHPIPKAGVTVEGLATIATMKYADGLPLNRVSNLLGRGGLSVDREKLAYWMIKIAKVLEPVVERCDELQRDGPLLQLDETKFQVLNEPGRTSEAKSWMIAAVSPHQKRGNIIRFHYSSSRSIEVMQGLVGSYDGILVTDGLNVYHAVEKTSDVVLHGGCWSHCRRKFFDAAKSSTKGGLRRGLAQEFVNDINKLFKIEKKLQDQNPSQILKKRIEESLPILDHLWSKLQSNQGLVPPESLLGKAMAYMSNQWEPLNAFTLNGHVPIHNNASENAIRPFVIGRKNWLFATSIKGAQASAVLYSLIETAKANKINPQQWLTHALQEMSSRPTEANIDDLLPLIGFKLHQSE